MSPDVPNNLVLLQIGVALVSGGLAGTAVRYHLDVRLNRKLFVLRLHEEWWSKDFTEMRAAIHSLVEDLSPTGPGEKSRAFLDAVQAKIRMSEIANGREFYRLAFFFADLNAALDAGLADEELAYRFFGEAQYLWFEPIMKEVRRVTAYNPGVRWVEETQCLAERFERIRALEDRKRLLSKRGGGG